MSNWSTNSSEVIGMKSCLVNFFIFDVAQLEHFSIHEEEGGSWNTLMAFVYYGISSFNYISDSLKKVFQ